MEVLIHGALIGAGMVPFVAYVFDLSVKRSFSGALAFYAACLGAIVAGVLVVGSVFPAAGTVVDAFWLGATVAPIPVIVAALTAAYHRRLLKAPVGV